MADVLIDFNRFCNLHSWYKHLLASCPRTFVLYPTVGQQPKNVSCEIKDPKTHHWWFIEEKTFSKRRDVDFKTKTICLKHAVTLGPFMGNDMKRYHLIVANDEHFEVWLKATHPDLSKALLEDGGSTALVTLFEKENDIYRTRVKKAADDIWNEL